MDYSRLIPETAPEDLFACIEKEWERFRKGVLSYRAASHEEAEVAGYCEDFGGDYRRDRKKRPALLWCSECGRESVAEWISAKSCHGYGLSSGIGIEDDFNNATGEYQDGAEMHCPACGENVTLKSATAMNHGHTDQTFITVPTVCGSYPVFTVFCAERRIYKRSVHTLNSNGSWKPPARMWSGCRISWLSSAEPPGKSCSRQEKKFPSLAAR